MTTPPRLVAVPGTSKPAHHDDRCRIAVQAVVEGIQDVRVQAALLWSGRGPGQIAIRVGRVLIFVNDREALESFLDAWSQAEAMADKAFGRRESRPYRPGSDR